MSPFTLVSPVPPNTYKTILDAVDGYQAIDLDEESQQLTTFITHNGLYHYLRVPAGLIDAGDKYTSRYDTVIKHIPRKVKCIDDTCLYDFTIADAFFHTFDYLTTCAEHGIVLSVKKFQFCQKQVDFAGFCLTSSGIRPTEAMLDSIQNFPTPKDITGIRSWFSLVRQVAYAHSITDKLAPFRELLKPSTKFYWNENLQHIFDQSKQKIVKAVTDGITAFDVSKHTCLQCDWSKVGIGFLLLQKHCSCPISNIPNCCADGWKLVFAGSRLTSTAESRYAPTEGEALAVCWTLQRARLFVLGCPKLTIVTDHKPLLGIFNDRDLGSIHNPRIQRFKEKTLQYSFDIAYCPGKFHLGADALSRHPPKPAVCATVNLIPTSETPFLASEPPPAESKLTLQCEDGVLSCIVQAIHSINDSSSSLCDVAFPQVITLDKLLYHCSQDKDYTKLTAMVQNGFPNTRQNTPPALKTYWSLANDGQLSTQNNIVLRNQALVIPKSLRTQVLRILHSAHQGCSGMIARATQSVYWPGYQKDIQNFRLNCKSCTERAPSQPREPLILTACPSRPFEQIVSDFFQIGSHHYLIIADRFSGFLHIFYSPHPPTSAFLQTHFRSVFSRYGRPDEVASDGGPQFIAHSFTQFLKRWGASHRLSLAYYPQSNGRAELAVKSAKRMLLDNADSNGSIDNDKVACAVLQYHNTPLPDYPMSPAQLLFGRPLADFLPANPSAYNLHPHWIEQSNQRLKSLKHTHHQLTTRYNSTAHTLKPLSTGQHVAIQNKSLRNHNRWDRQGIVVATLPYRQYRIRLLDTGNTTIRNRRFLKPIPEPLLPSNRSPTPPFTGPQYNDTKQYTTDISSPTLSTPSVTTSPSLSHPTTLPPPEPRPSTDAATDPTRRNTGERRPRIPLALRNLRPFNNPGLLEQPPENEASSSSSSEDAE